MKKTVVIYSSRYGSTKKYAEWISEALSCDIFSGSSVSRELMKKYDVIIYGGGLYAGGVNGINIIKKSTDILQDKELVIFTCGLADPAKSSDFDNVRNGLRRKLTDEVYDKVHLFQLRGGIDYHRLGFVHRMMMSMRIKMIQKKDSSALSDDERSTLETYGSGVDYSDKNTIAPIVSFVKNLD